MKTTTIVALTTALFFIGSSPAGLAQQEPQKDPEPFNLFEEMKKGEFVDQTPEEAIASVKDKEVIGLYFAAKW